MQTLQVNNTSPTCILCMLMPQIIPLLILMLLDMFYEESAPPKEMDMTLPLAVTSWCDSPLRGNSFQLHQYFLHFLFYFKMIFWGWPTTLVVCY